MGVVTRHLQRHRDESANPLSSRDDDHFSIYFGFTLGAFILEHTDNLSHALQGSSMSAGQGQQVAEEVCKILSSDRSETAFDLFWTRLLKRKSEVDAVSPSHSCQENDELPRDKK